MLTFLRNLFAATPPAAPLRVFLTNEIGPRARPKSYRIREVRTLKSPTSEGLDAMVNDLIADPDSGWEICLSVAFDHNLGQWFTRVDRWAEAPSEDA